MRYSRQTSVDKIDEFIGRCGPTESYYLAYGKGKANRHKGYGFVVFKNIADMKRALLESGHHKLDNRPIFFSVTKGRGDLKNRMGCWFCLDNPEADRSLIVHENDQLYVALDKGPIEKYHLLVIPQNHKPSYFSLTPDEKKAVDHCERQLSDFYEAEKRSYIRCERYFRMNDNINHLMIHFVSLPRDKFSSLEILFLSSVRDTKLEFFELQEGETVDKFLKPQDFYISMNFVDTYTKKQTRRLCILSANLSAAFPPDFMRAFLCEILDCRPRRDWKACIRKEDDESEFLVKRLKTYLEKTSES